ncbi:hypothetical protein K4K48_004414 [Colletotrichum sp. SAR 10_66]|nr:hypothetical protein K4K48_004414 [Colletotrichum sp. SAR 10_66]
MTSVTTPPSPETRKKPEASRSTQIVASPCGATVASDDYVLSAERPDGPSRKPGKKQAATIKKDSIESKNSMKVHTTTEETRNRKKGREKAKVDVEQDIPAGQSHHRDEPRHSPRKIKPMRRQSENHKVVKRKTEVDRDGSPKKARKDPLEVTLRTVEMVGRLSTGDLSYPMQGTRDNQVTPQRDPPKIQEYSTPYHDESDSAEEFDIDSPPPSPPRPVHQGGGRYAPDQLRRVA